MEEYCLFDISKRGIYNISYIIYHIIYVGYYKITSNSEIKQPKNCDHGIQPIFILFCAFANAISICEHFDPSVNAGSRYYGELIEDIFIRVYNLDTTNLNGEVIQPIVNRSCIGESPGKKLDQCKFNGYLSYDELCNPCEVKEFKDHCEEICEKTKGPPFGGFLFA